MDVVFVCVCVYDFGCGFYFSPLASFHIQQFQFKWAVSIYLSQYGNKPFLLLLSQIKNRWETKIKSNSNDTLTLVFFRHVKTKTKHEQIFTPIKHFERALFIFIIIISVIRQIIVKSSKLSFLCVCHFAYTLRSRICSFKLSMNLSDDEARQRHSLSEKDLLNRIINTLIFREYSYIQTVDDFTGPE